MWHRYFGYIDFVYFKIKQRLSPSDFDDHETFDTLIISEPMQWNQFSIFEIDNSFGRFLNNNSLSSSTN